MSIADWHKWRLQGLGSSDAPVIMGVSPYKTRFELWKEKIGLVDADQSNGNWATRRGHELEPKARANYELTYGLDMPATLFEHKDFPFLRASLDGYNDEKRILLEIKCPGKDDHDLAKSGILPEKYFAQVQHQLFVSGAELAHYYSYDGERGVLVEVKPDLEYIERLVPEMIKFWELVQKKIAPELSNRDSKRPRKIEVIELCKQYAGFDRMIKSLEKQKSEIREKILPYIDHAIIETDDVVIRQSVRQGNINYKKVPELKGIDLEKYRGDNSIVYTFTVKDSDS
jgi:putative phage-type endonuclease